jgi:hypothetical protein
MLVLKGLPLQIINKCILGADNVLLFASWWKQRAHIVVYCELGFQIEHWNWRELVKNGEIVLDHILEFQRLGFLFLLDLRDGFILFIFSLDFDGHETSFFFTKFQDDLVNWLLSINDMLHSLQYHWSLRQESNMNRFYGRYDLSVLHCMNFLSELLRAYLTFQLPIG